MPSAAKTVTKLISLNPQAGIIKGLAVPVVALVGGYILVSKLTGFNPAGDALAGAAGAVGGGIQAIGNAIGTVSKPLGDAIVSAGTTITQTVTGVILNSPLRFSKNPVNIGDTIHVLMKGLQPFQDVRIRWVSGGFDTGQIRADIGGNIDVIMSIPQVTPGLHQVDATVTYIAGDTRTFAQNLTVLGDTTTPPPPGIETIRGDATINPWNNLTSGSVVTVTYKLLRYVDNMYKEPALISGKRFHVLLDGNLIDDAVTNSKGQFIFAFGVGAYGLNSGRHSLDVYPFPYDGDKVSDQLLVNTGRIEVA